VKKYLIKTQLPMCITLALAAANLCSMSRLTRITRTIGMVHCCSLTHKSTPAQATFLPYTAYSDRDYQYWGEEDRCHNFALISVSLSGFKIRTMSLGKNKKDSESKIDMAVLRAIAAKVGKKPEIIAHHLQEDIPDFEQGKTSSYGIDYKAFQLIDFLLTRSIRMVPIDDQDFVQGMRQSAIILAPDTTVATFADAIDNLHTQVQALRSSDRFKKLPRIDRWEIEGFLGKYKEYGPHVISLLRKAVPGETSVLFYQKPGTGGSEFDFKRKHGWYF
jgi:hypothetical protein